MTAAALFRYWRDIEFFTPFDLDLVIDHYDETLSISLLEPRLLPWEDRETYKLNPEYEYGFDLFIAPFHKREILRLLTPRFPKIEKDVATDANELRGLSCLARIALDDNGFCCWDDVSVSTLPWALRTLAKEGTLSLAEFEAFSDLLLFQLQSAAHSPTEGISHNRVRLLLETISSLLPLEFAPEGLGAVLVIQRLRKRPAEQPGAEQEREGIEESNEALPPPPTPTMYGAPQPPSDLKRKRKVDILNSFYLRDLERAYTSYLESHDTVLHHAIAPVVSAGETSREILQSRIDIFSEAGTARIRELLAPQHYPLGRWPSNPEQTPALHQQVALNRYLSPKSMVDDNGIVAVDGPPGTGKTVIVRDIIASLVVQRAQVLATLAKPGDAFVPGWNRISVGKRNYSRRTLRPELTGFEIVISSSNNAAVENISKELPHKRSLGDLFAGTTFLNPIARMMERLIRENGATTKEDSKTGVEHLDNELWGLPSIALGNARNRFHFRRTAFLNYKDKDDKARKTRVCEEQALTILEWRAQASALPNKDAPPETVSFSEAKRLFLQELARVQSARPKGALPEQLNALRAPFHSSEQSILHSQLFVAALKLHEAWVREAPQLEKECYALSALLGNPQSFEREDATRLWQILFMLVPVVSTTLASVERMFAQVGTGILGHVIIDEAGQAKPQSVVGLLMRASRALILGDQRQLRPVTTTPHTLDEFFSHALSAETHALASPLTSSAQAFVDRSAPLGTEIGTHTESNWLSIPLTVHRRCAEPMFSLANAIAYKGFMVSTVPAVPPHPVLGASTWFQVSGAVTSKQWVKEHSVVCGQLVLQLLAQGHTVDELFVISPFREVAAQTRTLLGNLVRKAGYSNEVAKELRRRVGTIHTFQGKEAAIVFLVLGCDHSTGGSANWAGEEPNLLNVAVTRAKQYLYVIGDANVWHNRGYFSDLEKALPRRAP